MDLKETYTWLTNSARRQQLLLNLKQPMTAQQLSRRLNCGLSECSRLLWELGVYGLVVCLNPDAHRSRLYWLTRSGLCCVKQFCKANSKSIPEYQVTEDIPWDIYGWVCFAHRAAVIRVLSGPLQPTEIKRRILSHDQAIRISANNIRDIIKLFLKRGLVEKIIVRGKKHPRYQLSDLGQKLRSLLWNVEGSW